LYLQHQANGGIIADARKGFKQLNFGNLAFIAQNIVLRFNTFFQMKDLLDSGHNQLFGDFITG
jgi:hypothetical protein